MTNIKKIVTTLVVFGVVAGFASAAEKEEHPDGTLQISWGSFAAGIGFSSGSGTLTYKGKEYPVSVNGMALGKVGITKATARGNVYNLRHLRDFDGNYTSAGAGMTLAGGRTAVAMKNQNGVKVAVYSTTRGLDVSVGGAGVEMRIKK
jgi:hypothetical protein